MPRYFVYVNRHNNRKHIKIHPEFNKSCSHVFKHVKEGGAYSEPFVITKLDKNTIKVAEKENSYWLIVWEANLVDVKSNTHVVSASTSLGVTIEDCETCK